MTWFRSSEGLQDVGLATVVMINLNFRVEDLLHVQAKLFYSRMESGIVAVNIVRIQARLRATVMGTLFISFR
jgi:hypothetical protein